MYTTSTALPNDNSNHPWLQVATKLLKLQICNSNMCSPDVSSDKSQYLHEKNSWCWLKKSLDTERVLSLVLLSWRSLTIVWVLFCHQNLLGQQKKKMFSPRKLQKVSMLHPSSWNLWEFIFAFYAHEVDSSEWR